MTFQSEPRQVVPPDPFPHWQPPGFRPTMRDDNLPHQIRLVYTGFYSGGLGVCVKCSCMGEGDRALGERSNITSLEDAWELYTEHLLDTARLP
jgi:hypothetical protein